MAAARPRSYATAMTALRERLRTGGYPAGLRIAAVELADELGLSATPVREALARMAGEGLLEERRGQGYFVPVLAAEDVADLYRLSLAHLLIALDPRRGSPLRRPEPLATAVTDPVIDVEALFLQWVRDRGSRTLAKAQGLVQIQLGPLRRVEEGVLDDLPGEAAELLRGSDVAERLRALRQFHARRIGAADRLAEAWLSKGEIEPGI